MNFLTAAIPGLREVRGPLVAGYTWLVFAWLLIDPDVPLRARNSEPLAAVLALADTAGAVATAAAVSIVAYLVGSISTGVTNWVGRWAAHKRDARKRLAKRRTKGREPESAASQPPGIEWKGLKEEIVKVQQEGTKDTFEPNEESALAQRVREIGKTVVEGLPNGPDMDEFKASLQALFLEPNRLGIDARLDIAERALDS